MYKILPQKRWVPTCALAKLLLIMRLTTLILITGFLQVSASSYAQKITLSERNASLTTVLDHIRLQTGYDFLYKSVNIKNLQHITIQVTNAELRDVLSRILEPQQLEFEIDDNSVLIKAKQSSLIDQLITRFKQIDVSGKIVNEKNEPMAGATVTVKGSGRHVSTDANGAFTLENLAENAVLSISFMGYQTREIPVKPDLGLITLKMIVSDLNEVSISVNTGYQTIPKERATGAFSFIDKKGLDRRPLTDLLGRLEGMASGLSFSRTSYDDGQPKLSIRGRSTIYANDQPLIVLDGFPMEGDIRNINPNDVENVTLLKDAAAASIWGTRAANGVIVITTRKGNFAMKPDIEFRSQATIGKKPDLFYLPQMSGSDYIGLEQNWFNAGRYDGHLTTPPFNRPVLSEVVSTLLDQRGGRISAAEAALRLDQLRSIDVRDEATDVFYRNPVKQQHQVSLRGGGDKISYYLSTGYDKVLGQERGDDLDRLTLKTENAFKLLPSLNLSIGTSTTWGNQYRNGMGLKGFQGNTSGGFNVIGPDYNFYPYQRLRNPDASAVAVPRDFNSDYISYLTGLGFEDWSYRPADELNYLDNKTKQQHLRVSTQLNYKLSPAINIDLKYQYESQDQNTNNYQPLASYNTRSLINQYTRIVLPDSSVVKQLPSGDILDYASSKLSSHNFRGQLNYSRELGNHQLTAIAGTEVREIISSGRTMRNYGYDARTLSFATVDYNARYSRFPSGVGVIPSGQSIVYLQDRYVSFYANASYSYLDRYTLSASGRMDDSNLFGIDPRDRNVPLWSGGFSWNIDKEPFFNTEAISFLKLRTTYGFNGNISKTQTAYPIAVAARDSFTGLPVLAVTSPGNPYLQWEKMAQWNLGLDFSALKNRLSGTVEWFSKQGSSLLGDHYLDPGSGFQTIRANKASMKGHGIDVELNSRLGNTLQWQSKVILSYATDKITKVANASSFGTYNYVNADKQLMPVVGRPVYAVYSFKWAGLDKEGNPQLVDANGGTGNYNTTLNNLPPDQLVYNGPALPVYSGGWSHSLSWKNLVLSTSVSFKAGHKFRRSSINYTTLNSAISHVNGHSDYALRWQKAGDEAFTNVPALLPYNVSNSARDLAYLSSDILVEDASHIRWRDVAVNYTLPASVARHLPFKSVEFYLYMDNLGLIWRANKKGIDPDFVPLPYSVRLPDAMTTTLGLKLNL